MVAQGLGACQTAELPGAARASRSKSPGREVQCEPGRLTQFSVVEPDLPFSGRIRGGVLY